VRWLVFRFKERSELIPWIISIEAEEWKQRSGSGQLNGWGTFYSLEVFWQPLPLKYEAQQLEPLTGVGYLRLRFFPELGNLWMYVRSKIDDSVHSKRFKREITAQWLVFRSKERSGRIAWIISIEAEEWKQRSGSGQLNDWRTSYSLEVSWQPLPLKYDAQQLEPFTWVGYLRLRFFPELGNLWMYVRSKRDN
jgi:predicted DNA-binding ribbon-helix-helix protein